MSRDGPSPQALAYSVADAAKARSAQVLRQQRGRTADDIGSASFLDAESAGARLSQGPAAAAAVAPGVAIELVDVASLLTATSLRQTVRTIAFSLQQLSFGSPLLQPPLKG